MESEALAFGAFAATLALFLGFGSPNGFDLMSLNGGREFRTAVNFGGAWRVIWSEHEICFDLILKIR